MFSMAVAGLAKSLIVVTVSLHPAAAAPAPAHYTVRPGDSLSDIARREYGSAADWPALWWINRHAVTDPDVLAAGQRLRLSAWHPRQAWLDQAARAAIPAPARSASAPAAAVAGSAGPAPAPPAGTSPADTSPARISPAGTSPAGISRAGSRVRGPPARRRAASRRASSPASQAETPTPSTRPRVRAACTGSCPAPGRAWGTPGCRKTRPSACRTRHSSRHTPSRAPAHGHPPTAANRSSGDVPARAGTSPPSATPAHRRRAGRPRAGEHLRP